MKRKKLSEMSYKERVDWTLKNATWDEAEEAGIEILARCLAIRFFARHEEDYLINMTNRIADRCAEWVKEGDNITIVAFARYAHEMREKQEKGVSNQKDEPLSNV